MARGDKAANTTENRRIPQGLQGGASGRMVVYRLAHKRTSQGTTFQQLTTTALRYGLADKFLYLKQF